MTLPDLHPDELLWREACGTLSPNERADLAAHLQRCPACVLERVVRMEAARARVPSEADHALAARLVDRVVAASAASAASNRRPMTAVRVGWRRPLAVAAMFLLFVAGSAIAGTALVVRIREQRAARVSHSTGRAVSAARVAPGTVAEGAPAGEQGDDQAGDGAPDDAPVAFAAPPARSHRSVKYSSNYAANVRAARSRRLAYEGPDHRGRTQRSQPSQQSQHTQHTIEPSPHVAAASSTVVTAAAPAASESAPLPAESPSAAAESPPAFEAPALLRRAEQARTAKRWTEASRAFGDLARRYPGSREEIVGRALHAQLLLDQLGDAGRALAMFDRYLAAEPSGTLAEEARLGRAQALRRLGRAREERAAWLELLREHPGSVHAAAAQARLATLDAP